MKLVPSWGEVGARMRPSWAQLEPSWGQVGAKLGKNPPNFGGRDRDLKAILAPRAREAFDPHSSPLFPPSLAANMEESSGLWQPSWGYVGTLEQQVGSHNARLPNMAPKMAKDGPKMPNIAFKSSIFGRFWESWWQPESIKS